jgi:hypothetical protein
MRKSLSDSPLRVLHDHRAGYAVGAAVALSAALAVAAGVDQAGSSSLADHAAAIYAPHGEHADSGLLYGLVYFVAAIGAALWLAVLRATRAGKRWSALLAGSVVAINATLALTLLASTEYGARIFPPMWGALAALPCLPGIAAVWLLLPAAWTRSAKTAHHFLRGIAHDTRVR